MKPIKVSRAEETQTEQVLRLVELAIKWSVQVIIDINIGSTSRNWNFTNSSETAVDLSLLNYSMIILIESYGTLNRCNGVLLTGFQLWQPYNAKATRVWAKPDLFHVIA